MTDGLISTVSGHFLPASDNASSFARRRSPHVNHADLAAQPIPHVQGLHGVAHIRQQGAQFFTAKPRPARALQQPAHTPMPIPPNRHRTHTHSRCCAPVPSPYSRCIDLSILTPCFFVAAPRRMITTTAIRHNSAQLHPQCGFRHAGHADQCLHRPSVAVDFRNAVQGAALASRHTRRYPRRAAAQCSRCVKSGRAISGKWQREIGIGIGRVARIVKGGIAPVGGSR